MRVRLYLVLPDCHFPFQSRSCFKLIELVIKKLGKQLDGIIQLGDFVDNWQLSDYDKDPTRKEEIEDDLALYSQQLDKWEHLLKPGSEFHQLEGNHETRLRRFIWSRAARLHGIVRTFPEMLHFKDRNKEGRVKFVWHPYDNWQSCRLGDTIFHHGHYFDRHVAANNLTRYKGLNFVQGHTHRFQLVSDGTNWSASLGHIAENAKIAHTPTPQVAQQAFGIFTLIDGHGHLEPILIHNGSCLFRGDLLHAKA